MGNYGNKVCEQDLLVALKFLSFTLTLKVILSEAVCDDCWGGGMEGEHED